MNFPMKTVQFTLEFLTPAFLGDATQSGRWRTPPIKDLLRQYWRMAYAADKKFAVDVDAMRHEEGRLLGHAWLENDYCEASETGNRVQIAARKSAVRIRLSDWSPGKLKSWGGLEQGKVRHREAQKANFMVGPHAYLGYGPLDGRGGTQFSQKEDKEKKDNAAIQAGESATLSLAYPQSVAALIEDALRLMHAYGTLGGRSRNGWGSFALTGLDEVSKAVLSSRNYPAQRTLADCLQQDWPSAVGQALIWQTNAHADWKALMKTLAEIKIGLRTQFAFPTERPDGQVHLRHWLSYPVTNHSVQAWGSNARLPNSLRFKVRQTANGKLVGIVVHMPCKPAPQFSPDERVLLRVWQQVHSHLDSIAALQRVSV